MSISTWEPWPSISKSRGTVGDLCVSGMNISFSHPIATRLLVQPFSDVVYTQSGAQSSNYDVCTDLPLKMINGLMCAPVALIHLTIEIHSLF